jgi:uncharacterized membrane protein YccC
LTEFPWIGRGSAADPGRFALKSALRAAIVVPVAFALSLAVLGNKQMALFAAFGSLALLVFVEFGGPWRPRLRAYLALTVAGAALIVLGTLCSRSTWLATVVMALVGFAILFAGLLDDYVAAAHASATLAFVLPVMVPADVAAIPSRLAGWGLAGALCVPAVLLLWPERPRDATRHVAAETLRSLAKLVEASGSGDSAAEHAADQAARTAVRSVRSRFFSVANRPSGTSGPTAALGRLIEDLGWLVAIVGRSQAGEGAGTAAGEAVVDGDAGYAAKRIEIEAAVPIALRSVATRLEGRPSDAWRDVERVRLANEAFGHALLEHLARLEAGQDELRATIDLDDAYRMRQLSYGTVKAGHDALEARGGHPDGTPIETRRTRIDATGRLVRTHASMRSVWLRNSLRGALGLALAVLVGQLADLQHAFWIVLGTMSVLRSSAFSTSGRIASALLGTLIGIVVGGLIVAVLGSHPGALWAVLPVAVLLAAYAQTLSFAGGQAAFTIVVLVLFNLLEPVGWKVGLVRVEDVATGAAVSLVVGILVWPRGASAVLRQAVGAAYVGAAGYLDATITALLDDREQAPLELAARQATDTAQWLDATVRDYLAERSSAHGRLDELNVLIAGASRLRRVALLMQNAHAFRRLTPIGDESPQLQQIRDAFEAERRARCRWYATLGEAISQTKPPPAPEHRQTDPANAPLARVVLDRPAASRIPPGLGIAWAHRHLEMLAELEPALASAAGRITDGGR